MLVLFDYGVRVRNDDLSVLPYSRYYELAVGILSYLLDAFAENGRVADLIFRNKGIIL